MALRIVSADERLARPPKVNIVLVGPFGAGKTFQARTLDPATTLFVDLEAGTAALDGEVRMPDGTVLPPWRGDTIDVRREATALGVHPWEFARALACLMCGPNPAASRTADEGSSYWYGKQAYDGYVAAMGDPVALFGKYRTVYWDSITVASRLAFAWSQTTPRAYSEKTGKPDNRGAYGVLGQEMVTWLTEIQHIPDKSTVVVGILDVIEDKDIPGRVSYEMQIEGSKAGRELPGIFDQIITLGMFNVDANGNPVIDMKKGTERAFVCQKNNGYGVPAKGRSGVLNVLEPPNLGALIAKIGSAPRNETANFAAPAAQPTATA